MRSLPQFFTSLELPDAAHLHSRFGGRVRWAANSGPAQPGYRARRDHGLTRRKRFRKEHTAAAHHWPRTSALGTGHGEGHGYRPLLRGRAEAGEALHWRRVSERGLI